MPWSRWNVSQRDRRVGVPLPDVVDRQRVVHGLARRDGRRPRERVHLDVIEVVGGARRRDVALDVGRFERTLGRVDLERLQQGWVDDADHERHEGPDPHGQHGQRPPLAPDVVEQDQRRTDRHVDEEQLGREPRVDVGVAGAVDVAVRRVDHRPALEDVAHRLVQRDEREQHRDVGLDRWPHPGQPALGLDPAVEVVEHQRDHQRHDEDGERPVDAEDQERQLEDVEADVLVELRVRDPEVAAVAEQDPVVPLADRPRRADEREHEGDRDVDPPGVGPDVLLVAPDELVLLGEHDVVAGDAVAHDEIDPQHGEEDGAEDAEEPELDHEQRREDVVEVDRGEPEAVGVDVRQRAQRDQQDDDEDDEPRRSTSGPGAAAAAARGRPAGRWGCARREPNVRFCSPNGTACRVGEPNCPGQSLVGATRQRQPEWAGGCAWPVGNASLALTAPAKALSSQSEHPVADVTTHRNFWSAPAATTPAEKACVA